VRNFITVFDLGPQNLSRLLDTGLAVARGEFQEAKPLKEKMVGIYFRKPSTRTRTSFTVAAHQLGAGVIQYGPSDLQIVTGETIPDTARVLSGYLDALVVRTNESLTEMEALTRQDKMAVINAMSENEHPTQAIADLITIRDEIGRLEGAHVLYIGEGNNTTAALALSIAQIEGMQLTIVAPEGYGLKKSLLEQAQGLARECGSVITQQHSMTRLPKGVDVVYTTRWQTMGVPKPDENWRVKFDPYSVTSAVMATVSKPSGTIFMHDLPAVRGSDVTDEVLDGPQSRAFQQARHKLTAAKAVLMYCLDCI
jgi:ornithine carbamoyltransferase